LAVAAMLLALADEVIELLSMPSRIGDECQSAQFRPLGDRRSFAACVGHALSDSGAAHAVAGNLVLAVFERGRIGVWIFLSRQMQAARDKNKRSPDEIDDLKGQISDLKDQIDDIRKRLDRMNPQIG
jgi:hypothetical protein